MRRINMKRLVWGGFTLFTFLCWLLIASLAFGASTFPAPVFRWEKNDNTPAVGWKVYTCESGAACGPSTSAYNKATYSDKAGTVANTNPIVLNARGEADVYFSGLYKLVITDSTGVVQKTIPEYGGGTSSAGAASTGNATLNGSFESDVDADGVPDDWTLTLFAGGTSGLLTSDQSHALNSYRFTSSGTGGGYLTSTNFIEVSPDRGSVLVSWNMKSSVADVLNQVYVDWYDVGQTYLSTTTLYNEAVANPTTWTLKKQATAPPASTRFAKLTLVGAESTDVTPGVTYFDDVRWDVQPAIKLTPGVGELILDASGLTADRTLSFADVTGSLLTTTSTGTGSYAPPSEDGTLATTDQAYRRRLNANGAFLVDQANAGAAVTVNAASAHFGPDMWKGWGQNTDGVFTMQRFTGSPGNYLAGTVTTADASIGAAQFYSMYTTIEGYDIKPLHMGQSTAKSFTVSFDVFSSITGTFGASIQNRTQTRHYPFSYTVNAADTWERKTVTIPGDTSGSWDADHLLGMSLWVQLGTGSALQTTGEVWGGSGTGFAPTGVDHHISTLNSYLYLRDVQIEEGPTATPFEHRSYADVLRKCQRYFVYYTDVGPSNSYLGVGFNSSTTIARARIQFPVDMRVAPTASASGAANLTNYNASFIAGGTSWTMSSGGTRNAMINLTRSGGGWVAGQGMILYIAGTGWFQLDARL